MKVWRLVAGILSIVLCLIVLLQSCAVGAVNAISENGEVSGSAGFLVAIFMLAGGIVSIATRKAEGKAGSIVLIILFGLAALVGYANYGSYSDLVVWSSWCLVNAVLAVIALLKRKKVTNSDEITTDNTEQ